MTRDLVPAPQFNRKHKHSLGLNSIGCKGYLKRDERKDHISISEHMNLYTIISQVYRVGYISSLLPEVIIKPLTPYTPMASFLAKSTDQMDVFIDV